MTKFSDTRKTDSEWIKGDSWKKTDERKETQKKIKPGKVAATEISSSNGVLSTI